MTFSREPDRPRRPRGDRHGRPRHHLPRSPPEGPRRRSPSRRRRRGRRDADARAAEPRRAEGRRHARPLGPLRQAPRRPLLGDLVRPVRGGAPGPRRLVEGGEGRPADRARRRLGRRGVEDRRRLPREAERDRTSRWPSTRRRAPPRPSGPRSSPRPGSSPRTGEVLLHQVGPQDWSSPAAAVGPPALWRRRRSAPATGRLLTGRRPEPFPARLRFSRRGDRHEGAQVHRKRLLLVRAVPSRLRPRRPPARGDRARQTRPRFLRMVIEETGHAGHTEKVNITVPWFLFRSGLHAVSAGKLEREADLHFDDPVAVGDRPRGLEGALGEARGDRRRAGLTTTRSSPSARRRGRSS